MDESARRSLAAMRPGDHYCGIYDAEEEHAAVFAEFVRQGVERHEKILYLADLHSVEEVHGTLAATGIDTDSLVERGQLSIQTASDVYLKGGAFDPDEMILGVLAPAVSSALADGYSAVRATGEMTWVLGGDRGAERVIEYEARINDFIENTPFLGICQYCRGRFDPELMTEVLHTHPMALVGTDGCDNRNHYFVPAEGFLSSDPQAAIVDRWLSNLGAVAKLGSRPGVRAGEVAPSPHT